MEVGQDCITPKCACLECGLILDGAFCVGNNNATPKDGDITICIRCGHVMAFSEDLRLRHLTDDEIKEVAGDQRIITAQKALENLKREKWNADR
jgi:hypothetical protein